MGVANVHLGRRPVFGKDRMEIKERWCPAWPANPDTPRKAAYTRWIRGAATEVAYKHCGNCGQPFTYDSGKTARHGDRAGEFVHGNIRDCAAWLTEHPLTFYGPHEYELLPQPEPKPDTWHCADCDKDYDGPVISHTVYHASIPAGDRICPRCLRTDFRTDKGRTWHVENNPECTRYVKPAEHRYAEATT